ncbi:oligosaccharyl transferase stt3 subunit [Diatrype stigma]|uniref:Oligosaccharyl transferase stt3 subunit n=1 Tax=Diatrype stigma TaxID=117547 RepID=A0AAN9YX13_9PEZI
MSRLARARGNGENSVGPPPSSLPSDNGLYLPSGSNVFITKTKSGKPAFARKKKNDLLQDYGFDIFGQSFGIPSRTDLERQARQSRHTRHVSQSSGVITAPPTPRRLPEKALLPDDESESEPEEMPITARKPMYNDARPPTPLRGILKSPRNKAVVGAYDGSSNYGMGSSSSPFTGSQPRPPTPMPFQHSHYGMGNTAEMASGPVYHQYPQGSISHMPGHHPPGAYYNGPPNWVTQPSASQWANPSDFTVPQTTSMPSMPSQFNQPLWTSSSSYAAPAAYSTSAQPPSSVTAMSAFQGPAVTATSQSHPNLGTNGARDTSNDPHPGAAPKTVISGKEDKSEPQEKTDDKVGTSNGISKNIRHHHICTGCGKKRSRDYQKAHPLKRGEIPKPAYCARCVRDAEIADNSFVSDDDHVAHHGDVIREKTQKEPEKNEKNEPVASEDAVNVPRLLGAAAARIVSHGMQSNPPTKKEANESQESIPLSARTASATSMHLPQIFEAASKIIGHSKKGGSRKTQALEIGKEILQDFFASQPDASHSTRHPSRSHHDVPEAITNNGSRQSPVDTRGPTASSISTKSIPREREVRSPQDGTVPRTQHRDSDSTYRRPSVHEENSDLTAERPDEHRGRPNRNPADRPSADNTAHEPSLASPESHGEQMDAPREEFEETRSLEDRVEREAELDLAGSGKRWEESFNSTFSPLGGSATSSFPTQNSQIRNHLTESTLSIDSYATDAEVHNTGEPLFQQDDCSEAAETVREDDIQPPKQIEYSDQKEQDQGEPDRLRNNSPLRLCTKSHNDRPSETPNHDMTSLYDSGSGRSSLSPSPIGSSVIAHTGKSIDDLEETSDERVKPKIKASARQRILSFMGL